FPVMGIVSSTGSLVVLVYGGQEVMAGRLSVGDLAMFIAYLYQLAWPTMALGWMLSILQRGRAAMQRLNELLVVEPAIASPPAGTSAPCRSTGSAARWASSPRTPSSSRAASARTWRSHWTATGTATGTATVASSGLSAWRPWRATWRGSRRASIRLSASAA